MNGTTRGAGAIVTGVVVIALASAGCTHEVDPSPYAVAVVSFDAGEGAGYGAEDFPDVVFGPPRGGGDQQGSVDVLSLGKLGVIVVELGAIAEDLAGPDVIVFENPFAREGLPGDVFTEPAKVAVSEDGLAFVGFPCTPENTTQCAGMHPVYANADHNDRDPRSPEEAGGDVFDLATIGVERARFVRITDLGIGPNLGGDTEGFDLDAISIARHGDGL